MLISTTVPPLPQGMHSGIDDPAEVVYHRTAGRTLYGGTVLATAKLVHDAAQGAMVLLGEEAYKQVGV